MEGKKLNQALSLEEWVRLVVLVENAIEEVTSREQDIVPRRLFGGEVVREAMERFAHRRRDMESILAKLYDTTTTYPED